MGFKLYGANFLAARFKTKELGEKFRDAFQKAVQVTNLPEKKTKDKPKPKKQVRAALDRGIE